EEVTFCAMAAGATASREAMASGSIPLRNLLVMFIGSWLATLRKKRRRLPQCRTRAPRPAGPIARDRYPRLSYAAAYRLGSYVGVNDSLTATVHESCIFFVSDR